MSHESILSDWQAREGVAEAIVPLAGALYRRAAVVTEVFGHALVHRTPIEILQIHDTASLLAGIEIPLQQTHALLTQMAGLELGRCRVDLGRLMLRFQDADESDFLTFALGQLYTKADAPLPGKAQDVVLYGFGRIGRLVARLLVTATGGGDKYRLRAIVLRPGSIAQLERRASLLVRDSVHGPFRGTVEVDVDAGTLTLNGSVVQVLEANSPDELDYTAHGIHDAIIVDNTGKWRDAEGLAKHTACPGAARVILTAPGKGIPNVVYGVNHQSLTDETLISAASCTTNAIVPVLATLDATFGVESGHLETVHAYTNDQNLIDNFHKKNRRGRGAPLNMVITSTGAATAAAKVLPQLAGKLTGSAIRVPTPNVSLAILHLTLGRETTEEELTEHLRTVALDSALSGQIDLTTSPEVVSSDLVGSPTAGVVDRFATIVKGKTAILYVWYDNEYGYSCQVVRLMQHLAHVEARQVPRG